jgi:hypothetical protein
MTLSKRRLGQVGLIHEDTFELIEGGHCLCVDKDIVYSCEEDVVLICERTGLKQYGRSC